MIDPWGRVIDSLEVGVSGIIDVNLPSPLPTTIYAEYGERVVISVVFLILFIAIFFGYAGKSLRYCGK